MKLVDDTISFLWNKASSLFLKMLTNLLQLAKSASGRLRVRSALNPMLWLVAIYSPIAITGAVIFKDDKTICHSLYFQFLRR
jgi:hypothetical protein